MFFHFVTFRAPSNIIIMGTETRKRKVAAKPDYGSHSGEKKVKVEEKKELQVSGQNEKQSKGSPEERISAWRTIGHSKNDHKFTPEEIASIHDKLIPWYQAAKRELPWRFSLEVFSFFPTAVFFVWLHLHVF